MAGLLSNEKYSLYYQKVGLIYKRPEIKASMEVILSVFTVTILIFAAVRPTLTNIAALQKKIEDQETTNKKADVKMTQLFNAQKQLEQYRSKLFLFDNAVPDKFSYNDIIKRIEMLALKNALTVETINIQGKYVSGMGKPTSDLTTKLITTDKNNLQQVNVAFTVNGSPEGVMSFIDSVENMDRMAYLQNVGLATITQKALKKSTLRAQGQLLFYFYATIK